MSEVATFKNATSLISDKRINLVYGLNGAGKSTISNFLYDPSHTRFACCRKVPEQTVPILVYNQKFIQDNFFSTDNLKGIFSLSKENKDAEQKIADQTKVHRDLEQSLERRKAERGVIENTLGTQRKKAVDEAWKIKIKFSGGDRVLEYCLDGLKGEKEKLFSHILQIPKPTAEPTKGIEKIRSEADALKGDGAQPQPRLSLLTFTASDVESEAILERSVLGNTDSEVASLIEKLGNSDWVKQGLVFLPAESEEEIHTCPFCQQETISLSFVKNIKEYFDATYQLQIDKLVSMQSRYTEASNQLTPLSVFIGHPFAREKEESLSIKYQAVMNTIASNIEKIKHKIENPKSQTPLLNTSSVLQEFNKEVMAINDSIDTYNTRLMNRDDALASLKAEFWTLMRWQYDQTLSRFESDQQAAKQKLQEIDEQITNIEKGLADSKALIVLAQKETVNIDEAVDAINEGLLDLGIEGFRLAKHSDHLYRVVRAGDPTNAFPSLSEGEKMMISFLYFCELCTGKSSTEDMPTQRIVVIDDPISSLSHVFVYNVGRLIRNIFFKDDRFCKVFVLTHSLYFFYELTDTDHRRRKDNQKLFRITKSASGSSIQAMKYEEIQNDYQAYWSVINNPEQPPALVANCMRSIVEYFFSFVRKKDLNNVFMMQELQAIRFQAFCRFINRESHSLGQNIIDMKEFDYDTFKEGLGLVFEKTGYLEHFNEMSRL
ncbi:AAA family ATPase [Cyanobium sp. Copco_Reservoir_LC18]|uniref:AAA family ATPase n=1 Tax=Cyanobium sp. Copco_Reservoir_LC18 TaxID=1328305 RepID=UPI001359864B|nr:AAA family ATPase [Cyanobium sp. Copco_Reservoir_LC18]